MNKLFIAATALLFAGSLQAQTGKHFDSTAGGKKSVQAYRQMPHANLSDDQKKQAKDLRDSYRSKFAAIQNDKTLTAADRATKMADLRKEQHQKMQAMLTPEQKTQMASQRRGKGGRPNKMQGMAGKRMDKMKSNLGLTDEQMNKIKANQTAMRDKIKTIHSDQTLSDSQKREQVKTIMKQQKQNMKSVLTPEQMQKMKSMHHNRKAESAKA